MKKIIYSLTILAGLHFSSCSKYEEGPGISLRSKKSRLVGEWRIDKMYINDQDATAFAGMLITKTEFTNEGDYIVTGDDVFGNGPFEDNGKWEFSDDKSEILTTTESGNTSNLEILRLTNSELWVKEVSDGDIVELHYESK